MYEGGRHLKGSIFTPRRPRQLDVDIVFFDPTGVRARRGQVVGYVPTPFGKLRRSTVSLPSVVHKRGLFRHSWDVRVIRRMEDSHVFIFNPQVSSEQILDPQLLAEEPLLQPYLPESVLPLEENGRMVSPTDG